MMNSAENSLLFGYDASGLRTWRIANEDYTEYTYIGTTLVSQNTNGEVINFSYTASGAPYGFTLNGTSYFYLLNLQGDVIGIYDSNGTVVVQYIYDSWGKLISKELQKSADEYAASLCGEPIQKSIKEIGDTVTHPAFGEGKIIGYGKNKNSYRIKFDKLPSERDISAEFFNKPRNLPVIKHNISTEKAKTTEPPKAEETAPDGYKKVEETKVPEYKGASS